MMPVSFLSLIVKMVLVAFKNKNLLKAPFFLSNRKMSSTHVSINWVVTIVLVFIMSLMFAINGPAPSPPPPSPTSGRVELGYVIIEQLDPNTLSGGSDFFIATVSGFLYVSPEGVISESGQNSFLLVENGIVNLTRTGYYSGAMTLQMHVGPDNTGAQNMAFALNPQNAFPDFGPPPGWYGNIPFAWGVLPAQSVNTTTFSTPFTIFYNGTIPFMFQPQLVGSMFTIGTFPFGNVTLSINLNRYDDITGV